MKIYIDTNVYLDFFFRRIKSRYAENIFFQTVCCKHQIIVSNHVLVELTKHLDYEKAAALFEILKPKLIKVEVDEEDKLSAKKLPTHFADALHIVLAKKGGADVIVTNNVSDFRLIFKSKRPEDF